MRKPIHRGERGAGLILLLIFLHRVHQYDARHVLLVTGREHPDIESAEGLSHEDVRRRDLCRLEQIVQVTRYRAASLENGARIAPPESGAIKPAGP